MVQVYHEVLTSMLLQFDQCVQLIFTTIRAAYTIPIMIVKYHIEQDRFYGVVESSLRIKYCLFSSLSCLVSWLNISTSMLSCWVL